MLFRSLSGLLRPAVDNQCRSMTTWSYSECLLSSDELSKEFGIDMISIPSGKFIMGAPKSEVDSRNNERPPHEVTLQSFYLGRSPITQAQWRIVAGYPQIERELDSNPSRFKGDNRPVERVSWEDAQEFCERLSAQTGKDYRLPSEVQWEYGCRAGTTTPFHYGETITAEIANYRGTAIYNSGPKGESREQTTEVVIFPANEWGLHDMHGNVWEWCEDEWHSDYKGAPNDGSAWVKTDRESTRRRMLRGGSWNDGTPVNCRSACRGGLSCDARVKELGFRVCCVPPRTFS